MKNLTFKLRHEIIKFIKNLIRIGWLCLNIFDFLVKFGNLLFFSIILWNAVYFGPITFDFKKHAAGGYAMITGGAGGIGKATAEQMALRGIDLILIDFNGKLLEKTITEFQEKYPDIKIIGKTMDLTKIVDEDEYQKFEDEFRKFKIGILFNNAGIAEYNLLRFTEGTHSKIKG